METCNASGGDVRMPDGLTAMDTGDVLGGSICLPDDLADMDNLTLMDDRYIQVALLSLEQYDSYDATLHQVAMSSLEQDSLGPLIKDELRRRIQHRRLENRQAVITLGDVDEHSMPELTPADQKRRESRKAQNRRASQKYRVKEKLREDSLKQILFDLVSENGHLMEEMCALQTEADNLSQTLQAHLAACTYRDI